MRRLETRELHKVCAFTTGFGRLVASRLASIAGLLIVGLLVTWPHVGLAQEAPPHGVDSTPAERALQALRRAWFDEIDELTAITRTLAVSDDTYDFVARPNLPYVYDHYDRKRLASDRIDTVLIINRHRKPLFWRRVVDGGNRGFPDAEAFLAQLPPLTSPAATGARSLAGAVRLARGPSLVVALPIYPASGLGEPRGWLITARALDATQWHLYEELAHVTMDVLDPAASALPVDVGKALSTPLAPVLRAEAAGIRGLMSVPDLEGRPFRVFSVLLPEPTAMVAPSAPMPSAQRRLWLALAAAVAGIVGIAGVAWMVLRRRVRATARPAAIAPPAAAALPGPAGSANAATRAPVATPQDAVLELATTPAESHGGAEAEFEATLDFGAIDAVVAPAAPGNGEQAEVDATFDFDSNRPAVAASAVLDVATVAPNLRARLEEAGTVFCYQPQINLRTGRVAGVEALLCIGEPSEYRPATEVVAGVEAVGLAFELTERWLQEACSARRFWLRQAGDDFPVSVPVSPRILGDPAFPPLVRRILADYELSPKFLELEVPETTLGETAAIRGALADLHEAGVLVAIDGFSASKSNLRSLTLVPIAKLRVDPSLIHEVRVGTPEAALFDGIIGAAVGLGIIVCATGVDSLDLAATIERHGCSLAQGAALGPLVDGDRFLALVRGSGVDTAKLPPLRINVDAADGVISNS